MKILYDHQIFTIQKYGGISRYFYELIKLTESFNPSGLNLGIKFSNNEYLNSHSSPRISPFFPRGNFYKKQLMYNLFNEGYSKLKIFQGDFDVFHPTYYNPYYLKYIKNKPVVVTCYDMIHELYSELYPELLGWDPMIMQKKKAIIKSATKVIAISEQTKADIMRIYNMDGSNIEVIYLGNSLVTAEFTKSNRIIKDDYLLFVGNRSIYKNFSGLLVGVQDVLKKNRGLKLICAGGGDFSQKEIDSINELDLVREVKFISFKSDLELANLYQHAISFIFPSLYEGFGIPVLEAFASKCPIIMSAGGSLHEIGSDAAAYFDALDPNSINNVISKVISDSDYRLKLVQKGSERLKSFSWENTYERTISLYKTLI